MPPCAAATSGWYSVATSRSTVAPAPVTCLIMAGPSCCERYDEFLLDQPRVTLLRAAFLVAPDSPAPSFWSSASVPHREDRPLRGVGRGLSTSAGDAVPVTGPPRCNRYSAHEGPVLTRWSLPDLMSLSATRAADVQ